MQHEKRTIEYEGVVTGILITVAKGVVIICHMQHL